MYNMNFHMYTHKCIHLNTCRGVCNCLYKSKKVTTFLVLCTAVSVGFKDDVVIGNEGGPARICVTVSGSVQNDLLFNLTLTGGNASCECVCVCVCMCVCVCVCVCACVHVCVCV